MTVKMSVELINQLNGTLGIYFQFSQNPLVKFVIGVDYLKMVGQDRQK